MRGNWTPEKALTVSNRTLDRIEKALLKFGEIWGDEDNSIIYTADELRDQVAALREEIEETVKDWDEHHPSWRDR